MPSYTVTDPRTGRKATLTGDAPPTEADLDEVFAAAPQQKSEPAPSEPERTLLGIGEEGGGTLGDLGVMAIKGAIGLPQGLVGVGSALTGGRVGKAVEDAGIRFDESQKMLDGMYSPAQQAANTSVRNADGFMNTLEAVKDNPSTVVTTVGESLPSVLGGGVIAKGVGLIPKVAPWVAGAVGEGVMGAGSAAEQIREQTADGLLTTKQQLAAGGTGVGIALFGGVGGKLARKFGAGDIDSAMVGAVSNEARRGFAARLTAAGISEGVFEELPQSVQEKMWQNFAMDKPLDDGVGNAAAMGLVAGTAMGAGFESGRSLSNRPVNPNDGGTQQEADWGDQNEAPPAEAPPAPMQEQPEAPLADAPGQEQPQPVQPSELAKTADDLEAELGQGQSVDDQIAALEAELANPINFAPPAIPKSALPMGAQTNGPIGNEIDYSPVGVEPEGLSLVPKEESAAPGYRMIDPPNPNLGIQNPNLGIQSSPLDTLAQGVEAEIGRHIDNKRAARLPEGLKDNRLLRDHYRGALEGMTSDLTEGGGISYLRDENDRITGRTKSTNPSWFQSLNTDPGSSMSVKNVRKAVANALAGKKLFPRQARVIKAMLDEHQSYREDYAKQKRATRQEMQTTRRAALDELRSLSPEHAELIQHYGDYEQAKNAGQLYDEPSYHPDLTHHERANAELAEQAWALGASYDDIDSAVESGQDSGETTKALQHLIFGLRNEHRQRQADDRSGNRRGGENDVLAPESSEPVNQGGPEENNAPAGRMDQESPDAAQPADGERSAGAEQATGEIAQTPDYFPGSAIINPGSELDRRGDDWAAKIQGMADGEVNALHAAIGLRGKGDKRQSLLQQHPDDLDSALQSTLTGSDSPSDIAASHGQNDLFAGGGKAKSNQETGGDESQPPPLKANGFIAGPDGYRVRISQHALGSNMLDPEADAGAFVYEIRKGDNDSDPLNMVLNKEGRLVARRESFTDSNKSNGTVWVPPSNESADKVRGLLEKRAATRLGSEERKAIDNKIKEVVTRTMPVAAESNAANKHAIVEPKQEAKQPQPSAGVSVSGDAENKQGGISPADSARNDAILRFVPPSTIKGLKVDAPVFDENTGETHTEKVPAQEALDAVNADIETYKSLLNCVRGG